MKVRSAASAVRSGGVRAIGATAALATAILVLAGPGPALAQERPDGMAERERSRLLREAEALRAGGDAEAAELRLRRLLEAAPESARGVFALERLLRRQGRTAEVLPFLDAHLRVRPGSGPVRFLELRALAEADSLDALEAAAREWIEREPGAVAPYRRVVRVYTRAFGPERALEVVREARENTGRSDALALEAGDLRARTDDVEGAVDEWSRAIDAEEGNLPTVVARVEELDGDRSELVAMLVDRVTAGEGVPSSRLRAAARLALEAGLGGRARQLAERVLPELEARPARGFLLQFADRAETAGRHDVALWAYEELRSRAGSADEARSLEARVGEMALEAGDTARALAARRRVAAEEPRGSRERRRALAARIRLEIGAGEVESALRGFEAFRTEFPDAAELDELAARVSAAVRAGEVAEAAAADRVLQGVEGPRSSIERAYLKLDRGELASAVEDLRAAVDDLPPARATEVLELLAVLGGSGERGGELAGRVAVLAHRGRTVEALDRLEAGLRGVAVDDRPALLALGAWLAGEAGEEARAAALRERLVREFPEAAETPEAAVRLARHRARVGDDPEDAIRILEDLIVSRPESAVIPEARRELERLRSRIPGGAR